MVPASLGKNMETISVTPTDLPTVNAFLALQPLRSKNKLLILHLGETKDVSSHTLTIWVSDTEHIKVHFSACSVCVVPLNMLPGLYLPKRINRIELSDTNVLDVQIKNLIDPTSE